MKAFVDKDACISCGLCESLCPDIFEIEDDGKAGAINEELEDEKLDCANEAAEQCPTEAVIFKLKSVRNCITEYALTLPSVFSIVLIISYILDEFTKSLRNNNVISNRSISIVSLSF
jgi:ferredoxin